MVKIADPSSDAEVVRASVSLPKKHYDQVEEIAKNMRVSVAWVVREAVADYLIGTQDHTSPTKGKAKRKVSK